MRVRPAIGVERCSWASLARPLQRATRSASRMSRAFRICKTRPVSFASWLVVPQWTNCAASGSSFATSAVSCLTNGIAGFSDAAVAVASALASIRFALHFEEIAAPASAGITPQLASARASAASKSSMCWRRAASEKTSPIAAEPNSESSKAIQVGLQCQVYNPRSKNTVSSGPCKTTFHSSVPGLPAVFFAIKVERRSGSTRLRTKSVALRGSSGK